MRGSYKKSWLTHSQSHYPTATKKQFFQRPESRCSSTKEVDDYCLIQTIITKIKLSDLNIIFDRSPSALANLEIRDTFNLQFWKLTSIVLGWSIFSSTYTIAIHS